MAKRFKPQPDEKPTWTSILMASDAREKNEMNLVNREFGFGTFVGKVIASWCGVCGRYKMHYVPKAKLDELKKFTPAGETFPCTKCESPLPMIVDEDHTILRNV